MAGDVEVAGGKTLKRSVLHHCVSFCENFRKQAIWFEQSVERKTPNSFKFTQSVNPLLFAAVRSPGCIAIEVLRQCEVSDWHGYQCSRMRDSGSLASNGVFSCKIAVQFQVK